LYTQPFQLGRVKLSGNILDIKTTLVTGIVVALNGKLNSNGEFDVNDVLYFGEAAANTPTALHTNQVETSDKSKYVAFLSGLEVGNLTDESTILGTYC
jgi:hypothetical protein